MLKIIIFFILTPLIITACNRNNQVRSQQELIIGLASPPSTTDPYIATDATGMRLASLTHQSLVKVDGSLKPTPELAYKWEINNKHFKFFIKKESFFSDGQQIKCSDITNSILGYQKSTSPFKAVFDKITQASCAEQDNDLVLSFNYSELPEKFLIADLPVLKIISKSGLGSGPFF